MRISDIYKTKKQPRSFEIFPPKGDLSVETARQTVEELKDLEPAFISVTYSAGGSGNSFKTADLASMIQNDYGVTSAAHLTCINSTKADVENMVKTLKEDNIENILALRGDIVEGATAHDFKYASELIPILKSEGFCVGGACYPEGHVACKSLKDDINHLYEKEQAGADFFLSQLFFDNDAFFNFLDMARKRGVTKPIEAGVMPILSKSQITRMIFMCGASLPADIVRLLYKYENSPEDLEKAGIEKALEQIQGLLDGGVDGVHIYTMNKPHIAKTILNGLK